MSHIMKKTGRSADFRVKYRFYPPGEGGRKMLPYQGIRTDFWYEHHNHEHGSLFMIWPEFEDEHGNLILEDKTPVAAEGTARMWIINEERRPYHKERIHIGTMGWFQEGGRAIGECEVIGILALADVPPGNPTKNPTRSSARINCIWRINSPEQIPTAESVRSTPRNGILNIIFEGAVRDQWREVGESLKKSLPGFQVTVHAIDPEVNIVKLITDKEIEDNQDFFEQCAKDYRELSTTLIQQLAAQLEIVIDPDFPVNTFNPLKYGEKQRGTVGQWSYQLHGVHCAFKHHFTGQLVETPLTFGLEFGDLDPYFFSQFIKSTPGYRPMPVQIYEDYADGVRINEKMVALGKFERIHSNIERNAGVVVTDSNKIEVKLYTGERAPLKKRRPGFWRFLSRK